MTSLRTIKKIATVLLNHRDSFHYTKHDLLTNTADELYSGVIKPVAKFGKSGKAFSRFGIGEEVWQLVQDEIRSRPETVESASVDTWVLKELRKDMLKGGCTRAEVDNISGAYGK